MTFLRRFASRASVFGSCAVALCTTYSPTPLRSQTNPWSLGSGGTIYYNGGNVGIGTTSPQQALGFAYGGLTSDGSSGLAMMSGIYYSSGWKYLIGSAKPATIQLQTDGSTVFANGNVTGAPGSTVTGYGESMRITSTGNVGIGTTSPQYKLAVNGTLGVKEVIVTNTGWADYVFKPGYRLRPLHEVAAYIREHRHLPDIPSEDEVRANGVAVGDMQIKLLAKIEELTLHMIKADNRNERLEQQNREILYRLQQQNLEFHKQNQASQIRIARLEALVERQIANQGRQPE